MHTISVDRRLALRVMLPQINHLSGLMFIFGRILSFMDPV